MVRGVRGTRGVAYALFQERTLGPGSPLQIFPGTPETAVRKLGATVVPAVLSQATAKSLRDFALAELPRCMVKASRNTKRFEEWFSTGTFQTQAGPRAKQTRWDLRLPLVPIVCTALQEALFEHGGHLAAAFAALAGGRNAELWELSAMISAPGSAPQVVHYDSEVSNPPCLFSTFVALQDVTSNMGPTRFLLGTHSNDAHQRYWDDHTGLLRDVDSAIALLGAGDASLYDTSVLHAGGANRSDEVRVLLTITFRHCSVAKSDLRSMRPEYQKMQLRLGDLDKLRACHEGT
eukprot:gnl/MRDRNA2_/MRDRNA2_79348_c0_seq2.p1 gnl/MRDRNA2_/MRDRNA2_79348_c0~~gnl/MRDRNA2_/MRDRNA2_79348_c0_seq2.p1  ORF type:complete len:291 (+),score=44.29 gnl/MRDRNA2_/MRDRNA2_79348_c0_seq2:87-959(+)